MCRFKFRHWKWLRLAERGKTAGLHKAIINKSGYSDMLWPLFAAGRRCGCDPLQVPPLEIMAICSR